MKGPGLFSMLQFAAGLSMAGPMFYLGIAFVTTGDVVLGVLFFALGAVVTYAPTYFIRRIGGPRTWIRRRLRKRSGGGSDSSDDGATANEATGNERVADEKHDNSAADAGLSDRTRRLRERFSR